MRKLICLTFVMLTIVVSMDSCKHKNSKKDLISVDIDRSDTTSLPSAITLLLPSSTSYDFSQIPIQVDTFATKVDEYITPYGFTKAQITSVTLKSLTMTIENAPAQYFNFIKDMPVSTTILVDSFNGSSPKIVATKQHITQNNKVLSFEVSADDIKDYFRSDYMKILLEFRTQENESLDANTKFRVNYTFTVKADPNL